MKRASLLVKLLTILAIFAMPAFAGSITLSTSNGNGFGFTSSGGGNFTLNVASTPSTGISGNALDDFAGPELGFYQIGPMSGIKGSLAGPCVAGSCTFGLSGGSMAFNYSSSPGADDLLTGTMTLVDLLQSSTTHSGVFNDTLMVNLLVTGGALAGFFPTGTGVVSMEIKFTTGTNLATAASGAKTAASVLSGSVTPVPLPEPNTLVMAGTGLMGLASVLRWRVQRRKRAL